MNKQFMAAINQLVIEKNLPKEEVLEAVEAALRTAYRKDYGSRDQEIKVTLEPETGNFEIFLLKTAVKKVNSPDLEIALKEAKQLQSSAKEGEIIEINVTPQKFGRIAAQAAKQVILQRIQEIERRIMYDHFKERENELVNSVVNRVEGHSVFVEIEKNTVLLPPEEQVEKEHYYSGKRIKVYLDRVINESRGPRLLISRRSPKLVEKLFDFEIPEVRAGVVKVESVARLPGVRSKVAVSSSDPKVDPIGACVGQKGVRIQSVISELESEMIDVVAYSTEPEKFLKAALAPAKLDSIELDEKRRVARVFVQEDQRPLAIGRQGQNVRLAGTLTGWEIDILNLADKTNLPTTAGQTKEESITTIFQDTDSLEVLRLAPAILKKLEKAGIQTVGQLKQLKEEDLTKIGGIGKKTAEGIVERLKMT
ncbi:transcription termination/antitermination protein NusA [Candidatus Peregrinibacteria bacterium CG08_land_8_20_14_0_20_41_10]|nr:MAG: transcription termination factor NusA [Candidatus Peregrinibacteria bacterium CG1_02_41_10]PIS32139.1 MAG: transcription termination/antitermination protein NusA [Candidatus Peregrinibacteria bacterium CG08_land_8_20_14_0_20_41_10]